MAISESQLETWAKQGPTRQFTDTYNSVRPNLLDSSAPYPITECEVFLQGSYKNDTNVYGDSDVDIVLLHRGTFTQDISNLSPVAQAAYNAEYRSNASYPYAAFKSDAISWVSRLYNGVTPKRKVAFIPGNSGRRNADVLIAQQFRRYYDFQNVGNQRYEEGICFYVGGNCIENFPKQHSDNCTAKHQATKGWFKPMVRIVKNMRNAMTKDGYIAEGIAPSYFLEGMLWNVPNGKFGVSYHDTWIACYDWIVGTDANNLVCANNLQWLVRGNSLSSWPRNDFATFLAAAKHFWERQRFRLI